jgi:hypothetical protein
LNIFAMLIVIPLFVTKDPISIMRQSVRCAGLSMTILFGGSFVMLMQLSGIPAIVSVFLPAILLFPFALVRMSTMKT